MVCFSSLQRPQQTSGRTLMFWQGLFNKRPSMGLLSNDRYICSNFTNLPSSSAIHIAAKELGQNVAGYLQDGRAMQGSDSFPYTFFAMESTFSGSNAIFLCFMICFISRTHQSKIEAMYLGF